MTRINTNIESVNALRGGLRAQNDLQTALRRLSSGTRITRGADDPAGLIASERLRAETAGIGQGIDNSLRASNVIATAEGALNEVANLLNDIHGLILECANTGALSDDEIAADQLQIDSAVASINRIAATTNFAGRNLLDGSLDYVLSNVDTDIFSFVRVHDAKLSATGPLPVNVRIIPESHSHEHIYWASGAPSSLNFPQPCGNFSTFETSLVLTGPLGDTTLYFAPGSGTTANIVSRTNATTADTGITATIGGDGNDVVFHGNGYITIEQLPLCPNHQFTDQNGHVNLQDVSVVKPAEILVNGVAYPIDGTNTAFVRTSYLSVDVSVTEGALAVDIDTTFYVTDGGSVFQTGPIVDGQHQVRLGIPSVAPSTLGNATVGYLNQIVRAGDYSLVAGKAQEADAIVQEAIRQISVLRGRLGAFEKDVLQTSVDANQITLENVTASESRIRDADFAYETSQLTRAQILTQSNTSVMDIANHKSESVLSLLKNNG